MLVLDEDVQVSQENVAELGRNGDDGAEVLVNVRARLEERAYPLMPPLPYVPLVQAKGMPKRSHQIATTSADARQDEGEPAHESTGSST